jgi:hypothetical protein
MKISVIKTSILLIEKDQKDKILWAFVDEEGHTAMQTYSAEYPKELEEFITK